MAQFSTETQSQIYEQDRFGLLRKERITHSESSILRLKEEKGTINFDEMQKLLDYDFVDALISNQPESNSGRKNIVSQLIAFSDCQTFIERLIVVNPDLDKQFLLDQVNKFSHFYNFTESQKTTSRQMIEDYYREHERVNEMIQIYKGDIKSFLQYVSQNTKGEVNISFDKEEIESVEIFSGPICVFVKCNQSLGEKIRRRNHELLDLNSASGFADKSRNGIKISYSYKGMDLEIEGIDRHEQQHQKYYFLKSFFCNSYKYRSNLPKRYQTKKRQKYIPDLMNACEQAKDELLAQIEFGRFQIGQGSPSELIFPLNRSLSEKDLKLRIDALFLMGEKGDYDYFESLRKELQETKDITTFWELEGEYTGILYDAIKSFKTTYDKMSQLDFSKKRVINLFSRYPLYKWPQLARLVEHQDIDITKHRTKIDPKFL